MRVLIADEFSKNHLDSLRGLGLTVDYKPDAKADELPALAKDSAIVVVRSTEVKKAVFESAHGLSLVIRAGAGVNTIDVGAASARGVYVANCPGQNAIAVAGGFSPRAARSGADLTRSIDGVPHTAISASVMAPDRHTTRSAAA